MSTNRSQAVPEDHFKHAIVYQIYPSSFADGNGDGTGDLKGITSKVDYLKDLGVDVVWLSPIYKSPMKDMGYDISDYRDINPLYGSLQDWDVLKDELHKRDMKLMMDLVVNHTSDQHEWFKESRSSKDNPKRDWYIWRPARQGPNGERMPPNNWECAFGGESAWTWDELTQEYYLRLYVKEQPDLNWDNPTVRQAVWDIMRFWLDRGCDGFRMDVINLISKREGLPDVKEVVPGQFLQMPWEHTANGPHVHEYLREMHREVLSKYQGILTVGETPFTHDVPTLLEYSRPENKELQMVFTFELHDIDGVAGMPMIRRKYELPEFKGIIQKYQHGLRDGWNSLYLANHDQARSVSRFANDSPEFRAISAKLLATLHSTLSGTMYIYQGDEIGMKNVTDDWQIEDFPDVATQMYWNTVLEERRKRTGQQNPDMADVLKNIRQKARDNARTPIPWSDGPNGGFSAAKPWMRLNEDYRDGWNMAAQSKDPKSVRSYWKKMLAVRKANPVLVHGDFEIIDFDNKGVFAYLRRHEGVTALVLLSFTAEQAKFDISAMPTTRAELLISNYDDGQDGLDGGTVTLRPYEARLYLV